MTYLEIALGVVVVLSVLALASARLVAAEERLVVSRRGRVVRVAGRRLALVIPLIETGHRVDTTPRRRWGVVTATTRDGVTAHVRLEFVVQVTDPALVPTDLDRQVVDAVEAALRHQIGSGTVHSLPAVGDEPSWAPDSFLPGLSVDRVSVTVSDVQPTGELRRIVDRNPHS